MNIHRTIDTLHHQLDALTPELHHAYRILHDQRHRIDTYTTNNDNDKISGGDTTSTVERAAIARIAITARLDGYTAELHALELIIRNMRHSAQLDARRIGTPFNLNLPPPKRCDATNREGAIQWADPTCTRIPSRGPLCETCTQARISLQATTRATASPRRRVLDPSGRRRSTMKCAGHCANSPGTVHHE